MAPSPSSISSLLILLTICTAAFVESRTFFPSADPPAPPPDLGPIHTGGKAYRYVCDPDRFMALNLTMTDFSYCNSKLSYHKRVADLVGRMLLEEKVNQISDYAYGVDRIGLPEYKWWSEILHGVSNVGQWAQGSLNGRATTFGDVVPGATQFPEVINAAASFNASLWKLTGQAVSTEARAMYNVGHTYLTFWSPVINIPRDPRWGRIMETPGEDPFVIGTYAVNFVRGLQDIEGQETTADPNTRPIKVGSCCKHFAAYDIESWYLTERFSFDARVTEQDMVETFNVPFEMCVKEGDSVSVMCSYNKVNGFPSCADPRLLKQTIRDEWNLHGYIVSDCYIFGYLRDNQKWLNGATEDQIAKVMNAGLDLECGWDNHNNSIIAVREGKLKEKEIDRALKNLYLVLMRLGFFDGNPKFDSLNQNDVCTNETIEMAADSARQGMVLLKNINNALPLSTTIHKNIALGGTHYNASDDMKGNYAGTECRYTTPLNGFSTLATVASVPGCNLTCDDSGARDQMKAAAKTADATVLVMGINTEIEAEFHDRTDLNLPAGQVDYIQEVAQVSKNPIILVILSAGGVDISFARDNPKVGAILWAGYPGEEGGRAIADVVYGIYNPGGRLPITWYYNDYTLSIPMTSMQFRKNPDMGYPGRTYKFYDGPVVYPFGHGLSYTQFKYTVKSNTSSINMKLGPYQQCHPLNYTNNAKAPPCPSLNVADLGCNEQLDLQIEVSNVGKLNGTVAVIVYAAPPANIEGAPIKQVVAFERVFVAAGKSQEVDFSINVCQRLSIVDSTAYRVVAVGQYTITVGDESSSASVPITVNLSK